MVAVTFVISEESRSGKGAYFPGLEMAQVVCLLKLMSMLRV